MKEYRIVIIQRQCSQEFVQFLKTISDFRWIGFVRLCVGLVKLTQNSFTIPITKVNQKDQPKITTSLRGADRRRGNPVVHRTSRIIDRIATSGFALLAMTW